MNTYNTYQEAKIANPESEIVTDGDKFFVYHEPYTNVFKCHPSNYCITVEKFLSDGYEFIDGDVVLGTDGYVINLGCSCVHHWNCASGLNNKRYILRAAALEQTETPEEKEAFEVMSKCNADDIDSESVNELELVDLSLRETFEINQPKPKHTKVEYVKVDKNADGGKFWECARDFAEGACEFYFMRGSAEYSIVKDNDELLALYKGGTLRRKVETELTEREVFLFELNKLHDEYSAMEYDEVKGSLYDYIADSGKFKLVDGE